MTYSLNLQSYPITEQKTRLLKQTRAELLSTAASLCSSSHSFLQLWLVWKRFSLLTAGSQKSSCSLRSFCSDLWRIKPTADPNTSVSQRAFVSVCTLFELLPAPCNIMSSEWLKSSLMRAATENTFRNIINNDQAQCTSAQVKNKRIKWDVVNHYFQIYTDVFTFIFRSFNSTLISSIPHTTETEQQICKCPSQSHIWFIPSLFSHVWEISRSSPAKHQTVMSSDPSDGQRVTFRGSDPLPFSEITASQIVRYVILCKSHDRPRH